MNDQGFQQGIHATGRVSEAARASSEQMLTVKDPIGTGRKGSLPDLHRQQSPALDDVDAARAQEYVLLAVLLADAPDAVLLGRIATLRCDASPLGIAHAGLAQAATEAEPETVEREFFDLFIGVGRGELLPYASYYLTGFLHERPLARLRDDLHALGIERAEDRAEPEDHAAMLCEVMAGLVDGRFAAGAHAQQMIFEKHLVPWLGRFFADLERADAAAFYRNVGTVGRAFIEIESEAFALPA